MVEHFNSSHFCVHPGVYTRNRPLLHGAFSGVKYVAPKIKRAAKSVDWSGTHSALVNVKMCLSIYRSPARCVGDAVYIKLYV